MVRPTGGRAGRPSCQSGMPGVALGPATLGSGPSSLRRATFADLVGGLLGAVGLSGFSLSVRRRTAWAAFLVGLLTTMAVAALIVTPLSFAFVCTLPGGEVGGAISWGLLGTLLVFHRAALRGNLDRRDWHYPCHSEQALLSPGSSFCHPRCFLPTTRATRVSQLACGDADYPVLRSRRIWYLPNHATSLSGFTRCLPIVFCEAETQSVMRDNW